MIALWYVTAASLVLFVAAAIADYVPWGRAEWRGVLSAWGRAAALDRYLILRQPDRRHFLRRARFRLTRAGCAIVARALSIHQVEGAFHDHH